MGDIHLNDSYDEEFIRFYEAFNRDGPDSQRIQLDLEKEEEETIVYMNPSFKLQNPVELVLFYGPPFSKKTPYYYKVYSKTHKRISTREWVSQGNSLHIIVQNIVTLLLEGNSIVIDDTNELKRTRGSYIKAVQGKVPNLKIIGIEFRPYGGQDQSLYMSQWASFTTRDDTVRKETAFDLVAQCRTFYRTYEPLNHKEGFDLIKRIISYPYAYSTPFDRPALFVDANALYNFIKSKESDFEFNLPQILKRKVTKLKEWHKHFENGEIIILVEDKTFLPSQIEFEKESPDMQTLIIQSCHQQMKDRFEELKRWVPFSIYWTHYNEYDSEEYLTIPSPGVFAWLQFQFKIDFPQSVFVSMLPTCTLPCNITYCRGDDFFSHSSWDIKNQISQYGIPNSLQLPFLRHIQFIPDPPLPTHSSSFSLGYGREFVIYIPDEETTEGNASTTKSKKKISPRKLPSWMQSS